MKTKILALSCAALLTFAGCAREEDKADLFLGDWSNNPQAVNGGIGIRIEITKDGGKVLVRHKFLPNGNLYAQNNAKMQGEYLVIESPPSGSFKKFMHVKSDDTLAPVGNFTPVIFHRVN